MIRIRKYGLACTGVLTINYQNEQVLTIYFTKVVELYFRHKQKIHMCVLPIYSKVLYVPLVGENIQLEKLNTASIQLILYLWIQMHSKKNQ